MADPVVRFDGVWKKFRRGERHDSLRDLVPALARRAMGRRPSDALADEEFWALEDVSFELGRGEALGIIGPNGAGKSTILKLLTKILRPTRGRSDVRGRVGALIEIAAGFHPDLTGRENIHLQGAVLGMKRAEIARAFDDIVDFAGIGEFVDTPVKRYSSGMNARLGFSIAAHLNPDALIIDEVLSVGDMAFQYRCLERMRAFREQGVTIVFVSHNLQAVAGLCQRALHLERRVQAIGPTDEVMSSYVSRGIAATALGTADDLQILSARLLDAHDRPVTAITPGQPLRLRVTYRARTRISDFTFGFLVHRSTDGLVVYDGNFRAADLGLDTLEAGASTEVDFAFRAHLRRGQYHLDCHALHNPTHWILGRRCPAGIFAVHETHTRDGVADLAVHPVLRQRSDALVASR